MDRIKTYHSIGEFNQEHGLETLHPLMYIMDLAQSKPVHMEGTYCCNYYQVFLKDIQCGNIKYGRNYYDYQEGTLVFLAPMQVFTVEANRPEAPRGWALVFHPDLLRGTPLGRTLKQYTFFSYAVNEALHLSEPERHVVLECFHSLEDELRRGTDPGSRAIILSRLELFLHYCRRFYERQFTTRSQAAGDTLARFEQLLDNYLASGHPAHRPTVKYFAGKMNFSANYLSDLLRKDTGKSALEHIQRHLINAAKEKLFDKNKPVGEIAYELGFEYPQYFCRLFKQHTGMTPNEYRRLKP
jgi:AraC-like DNA-binding protein